MTTRKRNNGRKDGKREPAIKLARPVQSTPPEGTLLQLAQERGLFEQAEERNRVLERNRELERESSAISPGAERIVDSLMWAMTLAMAHLTFDALVQRQYAVEFEWRGVAKRSATAFLVFLFLFYFLHPHASQPILLPGLPARHQHALRQTIFFVTAVAASCSLLYISDRHGYLRVMKQAPTLGCLAIWSVAELDLQLVAAIIFIVGAFALVGGGYRVM